MKISRVLFVGMLITILFSSCAVFNGSITKQVDQIMGSKRFTFEAYHSNNQRDEQEYRQKLTFLKEINRSQNVEYTLYDVIYLPYSSFDISDKMYLVVDEEVFPLENDSKEKVLDRVATEEKQSANSETQPVADGYSTSKSWKMVHPLSEEMILKIVDAQIMYLRYYAGPNMITSEITGTELTSVKRWIKSNN